MCTLTLEIVLLKQTQPVRETSHEILLHTRKYMSSAGVCKTSANVLHI